MTNLKLIEFETLPSTNSKLKELGSSEKLPELTVVFTKHQYAGRGQMGNTWESDYGLNLTFSILLRPSFIDVQDQFILSKITSLSIVDTLNSMNIEGIKIKWPNDIYYHKKKLAGILIENSIMGRNIYDSVIGIGLNINQIEFKSDAPNPVSIKAITGKNHDVKDLMLNILDRLTNYYQMVRENNTGEIDRLYLENLYQKGIQAGFRDENGEFAGTISGVDRIGRLLIQTNHDETRRYEFKEVEFIL